jgi:hypothetical protein
MIYYKGEMIMDKVVGKIVALGVPGLVLLMAIEATGLAGAAALTTALAAIGPFGMLGGIATLGLIVVVSQGIIEYGFETLFKQVVKELIKNGETKESILSKINSYWVSKSLKLKLVEVLEKNWNENFNNLS